MLAGEALVLIALGAFVPFAALVLVREWLALRDEERRLAARERLGLTDPLWLDDYLPSEWPMEGETAAARVISGRCAVSRTAAVGHGGNHTTRRPREAK